MDEHSGSFLVEDFLQALTAQLDRTQDALRLKAVNRPLTYAIKDFNLELKVFVEMDGQGNVRFRPGGPNEAGTSSVSVGFTTITRPMIDENTVSLAVTKSPSLAELGFDLSEQQRFERLGVRNAAELKRLGASTGKSGVSRLSGISLERLEKILQATRPSINQIEPVPPSPAAPGSGSQPSPKVSQPPVGPVIRQPGPVVRPPIVTPPSGKFGQLPNLGSGITKLPVNVGATPETKIGVKPGATVSPPVNIKTPAGSGVIGKINPTAPPILNVGRQAAPVIRIAPDTNRLRITGQNLADEQGVATARLNDRVLEIREADDQQIVLEIPDAAESGALEITLPDGEVLAYELSFAPETMTAPDEENDPWMPN